MDTNQIRDLLYFDFPKAASLWSQLEGGLLERTSVSKEEGHDTDVGGKLGIPKVVEMKFGNLDAEKTSILESKVLHHDLLNKLEDQLSSLGLVVNLNTAVKPDESSEEVIRASFSAKPYISAQGWTTFEDYRRISAISERFNDLIGFVSKSISENAKGSPEYKQLQQMVNEARDTVKQEKDRNKRAVANAKLQSLEKQAKDAVTSGLSGVDSWILDGVRLWISTFMPNRINFRVYPFVNCPSFQIISNLKQECFVDQDLEHLLYGYGNRPNIQLSVFGIITSLPQKEGHVFDPMKEFEPTESLTETVKFEKAFRAVFGAMDGMESFVRYSRYPNVTVHPIAVYREITFNETQEETN